MGTNKFTKEQMEQLRLNPYVEKVSETTITYTTAFKERFHQEWIVNIKLNNFFKGVFTILNWG